LLLIFLTRIDGVMLAQLTCANIQGLKHTRHIIKDILLLSVSLRSFAVDEIEKENGNDPVKDLQSADFHDYQRP
jgi:hypothetical protein